jgi:hypothetical protein
MPYLTIERSIADEGDFTRRDDHRRLNCSQRRDSMAEGAEVPPSLEWATTKDNLTQRLNVWLPYWAIRI